MRLSRWSIVVGAAFALMFVQRLVQAQRSGGTEDMKVDHFEKPVYPRVARSARVQGAVVLKVLLDEQGRVFDAAALTGNRMLTPGAVETVKKWTFYASAQREEIVVFAFTLDARACGTKKSPEKDIVELIQPNLVLLTACPPRVDV